MFFIATLLLVLLSACALAAPPMVPPEANWKEIIRLTNEVDERAKANPAFYKPAPVEKPVNETAAEAKQPTTTCTYQVNYKMNTFYLFGDNWNVTKDTIKKSCEKGTSRVLNHWSYREWNDVNGTHFCAKVSFVFFLWLWVFASAASAVPVSGG